MPNDIVQQLRDAACGNDCHCHYCERNKAAANEIERLRARVKELERITDWHIDMVIGDAWLCRIEGKFEDIDLLLGNAVGKQIQAYEIDTSHHESTDP